MFASEFELFNHRVSECKPNRAISIVKISSSDAAQAQAQASSKCSVTDASNVDEPEYEVAYVKIARCQGCGTKCKNAWNLKRHKQICPEFRKVAAISGLDEGDLIPPEYGCDQCGVVFNRIHNLHRHKEKSCKNRKHKTRSFVCSACKKKHPSRESLRNHKLRNCAVLGKSTETHANNKPKPILTCKGCGTNFTKTYNLHRHQSKACPVLKASSNVSVCYICSNTFASFELLEEHLKQCHQEE